MTEDRRKRLQKIVSDSSMFGLLYDREREVSHLDNPDAVDFVAMIDEEIRRRESVIHKAEPAQKPKKRA